MAFMVPHAEGFRMNDTIRAALTVGAAIVVAMGMYIYFSPYQSCVRSISDLPNAAYYCAHQQ